MSRAIKFGFLGLFIVLVIWGLWALLHPARQQEKLDRNDDGVILLVLDPGHGGDDPGAMAGEAREKDINLAVALLVRERLTGVDGLKVIMTREDDTFPSLSERAEFANRRNADLYVSIHANALEDNDTYEGIFTFYHPNKKSSQKLAETIQKNIVSSSGGTDRGVRTEDYAVLRETAMPAVLIETGFMTTPSELARLNDPAYRVLLAQGIAQGILEYLGK